MNNTDITGQLGVHKCGLIFGKMGFLFRPQTVEDYGIDAIIETVNNGYPSGKLIAVQIKSGDSYFKEKKDNNIVFRGDITHYNYWINHSLPVIIILYSETEDRCIWEVINKQTAQKCEKGWKINIPYNQTLENSMDQLQKLANEQSVYESRWASLVIAKKWMLETLKYGNSILEVEEWVNKSSGRGKFTLKVENDGKEEILFERELFGFGTRKYEQVIKDFFPWANISIDEEFYNENMEKDFYYIKESNDEIYPYDNGSGEVDFYRLKLTLNPIGKSFLEMEKFLETGNYYLIDKIIS